MSDSKIEYVKTFDSEGNISDETYFEDAANGLLYPVGRYIPLSKLIEIGYGDGTRRIYYHLVGPENES